MMNWETYLAFGDSITIGARTYLGYPEIVGNTLSTRLAKQWNVINHSVSGFKAIDLARYIDQHFANLKSFQASISTILIGTNDLKEHTSAHDFLIAYNQLILKVKLLTTNKNVVLIQIPEFHQGLMYPYFIEMNETAAQFNSIIDKLADEHSIRVLKLEHSAEDFLDGIHLNEAGNKNFARQISSYILNDKGIQNG